MTKAILFAAITLATTTAFAKPDSELIRRTLETEKTCSNYVRYDDDHLYLGFGAYKRGFEEPRQPIPASYRMIPLGQNDKALEFQTADAALDSIRWEGDTLYILTYSGIEEWSLASRARKAIHQTYFFSGAMAYKQHAMGFARYGDKAIIAHGRLGVSIFNMKTKRIVNQFRLLQRQLPLESMAMGVTVEGKFAYVVMDNFTLVQRGQPPPFRGIVVIDLEREVVVSEMVGLDPGADAVVSDSNKLIVSYIGDPLWKFSLNALRGGSLPAFEKSVRQFPIDGHPVGSASMDAKYYYTCFSRPPLQGEGRFYVRVPMALDRRALGLD